MRIERLKWIEKNLNAQPGWWLVDETQQGKAAIKAEVSLHFLERSYIAYNHEERRVLDGPSSSESLPEAAAEARALCERDIIRKREVVIEPAPRHWFEVTEPRGIPLVILDMRHLVS